jgi:hypothetical protein
LRECNNLAMPGLVVGLLVRHLDRVGDELDAWLARPDVWEREFARVTVEGQFHVQEPDAADLAGLERRRFSMRDVATHLMIRAMLSDDTARIQALEKIADTLLEDVGAVDEDVNDANLERLTRAGWASCLRRDNYRATEQPDGQTIIEFEPPAKIAAGLAPSSTAAARAQRAWFLVTTYGARDDRRAATGTLADDLAFVRHLVAEPPDPFGPSAAEAAAAVAVAATALTQRASGDMRLSGDDLAWAAELLIGIALEDRTEVDADESMSYVMGAMRSVACGLPALLIDSTIAPELPSDRLRQALWACAVSPSDEVRRLLVQSLGEIWTRDCTRDSPDSECPHELALKMIKEMLRDCRLGDWRGQRREIDPLSGDPVNELETIETTALLLNRLSAPLAATLRAARTDACVRDEARRLEQELLPAYQRGAVHWDEQNYGSQGADDHRPVARELFIAAAAGDPAPLHECVRAFAGHADLTERLLHQMLLICTYDPTLRGSLAVVWPGVMRVALDLRTSTAANGRHRARVATSVIPQPSLEIADRDSDNSLAIARADWIDPASIAELVEEWISTAPGDADAVDALVSLIRTGAVSWQATVGLAWIEDLIAGSYATVARRSWLLPDYLLGLRGAAPLTPATTAGFHRLIDGLVAAGDQRFVALQRAEE